MKTLLLTHYGPEEKKVIFENDSLKMRLPDYRLKFAELIGPWTSDPPNKKNEIFQFWQQLLPMALNGLKKKPKTPIH